MPNGRGATMLEDLPEEIINNILVRLPSMDVGRCRAVSTSWRSATSTPEFMLRHHRRQPSLPIIDGGVKLVAFRAGASSSRQPKLWPFLQRAKHRHEIRLRGACDGLLAVSWKSRFYVCNPVLHKHALLPQPQHTMGLGQVIQNIIIGFYQHQSTGEHRVLWISQHLGHKYSLYILTVGCDTPRHVRVRLPATSASPSVEQKLLNVLFYADQFPVVDNGNLHWQPYCTSHMTGVAVHGQILVFDTEAESFRWMRYPAQLKYNLELFVMNGRLAFWGISRQTYTAIDIWVMQDYEAEIWAVEYRIDLSVVEASRQLHLSSSEKKKETRLDSAVKWVDDMVMLDERELLIVYNARHALCCDVDGRFLGTVKIGKSQSKYGLEFTHFRLEESIIPFPYHEMREEEDEEEPFSIKHV